MKNKQLKKSISFLLIVIFVFQMVINYIPIIRSYATTSASDSNAVYTSSNADEIINNNYEETIEDKYDEELDEEPKEFDTNLSTPSNGTEKLKISTPSNAEYFYDWYWNGTESNDPIEIYISNKNSNSIITKRDVLRKLPFSITFINDEEERIKMEIETWESNDFPKNGSYVGQYEFYPIMYEDDLLDDLNTPIAIVNVKNNDIQSVIDQINKLPNYDEIDEKIYEFENNDDLDGLEKYLKNFATKAWLAYDSYLKLNEEMKSYINNIDMLMETSSIWSIVTLDDTSNNQISNVGGSTVSDDGRVTVSKTIAGTDTENVFDITLSVTTQEKIEEIISEPDMAVVFVMDISYTMRSDFNGISRYEAAMQSADLFLDKFAEEADNISKVGYVAFNSHAYEIAEMQTCSTQTEADELKELVRTETEDIIYASGYNASKDRFTNIEAGLKMGYDLLNETSNTYKYIIFLSDGFPTTYLKSGYTGYNTYTGSGTAGTDGVFYDSVAKVHCDYGTSYSDKAAIRAREMATTIKEDGINIFSVGVDVDSTLLSSYFPASGASFSVVDRTSTTYEIGDANSTKSFPTWLKGSADNNSVGIGSGYYYESSNTEELSAAYESIFNEIIKLKKEATQASWVAKDPLPTIMGSDEYVGFMGFFDENDELQTIEITGSNVENGENTVYFDYDDYEIHWDLKNSGYETTIESNSMTFYYELIYRVRLKTENTTFEEGNIYPTNETTTLTYHITETIDDEVIISEEKTLEFQIPAVTGNICEFQFKKVDIHGNALENAKFKLIHDINVCEVCVSNKINEITFEELTAISDVNGLVRFDKIPSGHQYELIESMPPEGYSGTKNFYYLTSDYDSVSVSVKDENGNNITWNGEIENHPICNITITKNIDNVYEDFGSSTFLYVIEGTDFYGNERKWTKSITINKNEVTGTVHLNNIPASNANGYKITEILNPRNGLTNITGENIISNTINLNMKSANLDLYIPKNSSVVFDGILNVWNKFSHSSMSKNEI